jgi:predicted permease
VELGVKVDDMVMFAVSPLRAGYDTTRARILFARTEDELRSVQGITGVTSSMVPLLGGSNWGNSVRVQGFECGPDTDCSSRFNEVGAGYFGTMGITVLRGRDFGMMDQLGSTRVAIVNETFARKFALGADPTGKYMGDGGPDDSLDILIVGLVKDAKYSEVKDTVPPLYYVPWMQDPRADYMNFMVRSSLPPEQLLGTIPAVMKRIDAGLPIEDLKTMPQQIRDNIFLDRMISTLTTAFALLATLLAGVGLYGVLAYSVAQRTREIGVRMALGADGGRVRAMVLRQVGAMIMVGTVIGILAALALGRAAQSLLYGLQGHDPLVFALAILALVSVAFVAGFLPARRASQTDPMNALRYD